MGLVARALPLVLYSKSLLLLVVVLVVIDMGKTGRTPDITSDPLPTRKRPPSPFELMRKSDHPNSGPLHLLKWFHISLTYKFILLCNGCFSQGKTFPFYISLFVKVILIVFLMCRVVRLLPWKIMLGLRLFLLVLLIYDRGFMNYDQKTRRKVKCSLL